MGVAHSYCYELLYISITIVQNYTRKYHEFVAVCIVTSVQHMSNDANSNKQMI